MTAEAAKEEQSMEDILSSIRKIISEEEQMEDMPQETDMKTDMNMSEMNDDSLEATQSMRMMMQDNDAPNAMEPTSEMSMSDKEPMQMSMGGMQKSANMDTSMADDMMMDKPMAEMDAPMQDMMATSGEADMQMDTMEMNDMSMDNMSMTDMAAPMTTEDRAVNAMPSPMEADVQSMSMMDDTPTTPIMADMQKDMMTAEASMMDTDMRQTMMQKDMMAEKEMMPHMDNAMETSTMEMSAQGDTMMEMPSRAEPDMNTMSMDEPMMEMSQDMMSDDAKMRTMGAMNKLMGMTAMGGNTLDTVVKEMLRPMMAEWLDKNLPMIVERKVEDEVRRISEMMR